MAFVDGEATIEVLVPLSAVGSMEFSEPATIPVLFGLGGDLVNQNEVARVRALTANRLRVEFREPVDKNAQMLDRDNYSIALVAGVGAFVSILEVVEPSSSNPDFIDLEVTEMTNGVTYSLTLNGSGDPLTSDGVPLLDTPNTATDAQFTGLGELPTVSLVLATSETTAEVRFSETMKLNADLMDPTTYSFNLGLSVVGILSIVDNVVELETSAQTPGELYTATVDGTLYDGSGNALTVPATASMLGYVDVAAVDPALTLRMYEFILRGIREMDQKDGGRLLERLFEGPQNVWATTTETLNRVPELWDVTKIDDEFLQYLKNVVGWTERLSSITDALDATSLRRLISSSVAFWKSRGTETSTENILRLATAARVRIMNWFDYRFVVGETELSHEYEGRDFWIAPFRELDRETVSYKQTFTGSLSSGSASGTISEGTGFDCVLVFVATKSASDPTVEIDSNAARLLAKFENDGMRVYLFAAAALSGDVDWSIETADTLTTQYAIRTYEGLRSLRALPIGDGSASGINQDILVAVHSEVDDEVLATFVASENPGATGAPNYTSSPDLTITGTVATAGFALAVATPDFLGERDGVTVNWKESSGEAFDSIGLAVSLPGRDSDLYCSGDEMVYNIRIVDNGLLDRQLVVDLAKLTRPIGERVEIDFLAFLDEFLVDDDDSQWTDLTSVANGYAVVTDDGTSSWNDAYVSVDEAPVWSNYVALARIRWDATAGEGNFFFYGEIADCYLLNLSSTSGATLYKVTGSSPAIIGTDATLVVEDDVWYTVRIEAVEVPTGLEIRVFVDSQFIIQYVDSTPHASGTIGLLPKPASGGSIHADIVELFLLPLESALIDLQGVVTTSNFEL